MYSRNDMPHSQCRVIQRAVSVPMHRIGMACTALLLIVTVSTSPNHADLPPIVLSVEGPVVADGTERAFNLAASTLHLVLSGDAWAPDVAVLGSASRAALLGSFASQQPLAASGWTAVVAPVLGSASLLRASPTLLTLSLPQLHCFDLLVPELVTVRVPGAAIASGRSVVAPSLRISAIAQITPPRWGSVLTPPRELGRNCTHVTLSWDPPYFDGGTALSGYRLETRRADGSDPPPSAADEPDVLVSATDGTLWRRDSALLSPLAGPGAAVTGVLGPLLAGVAYEVRVRAFSVGTGCMHLVGDDGAVAIVYGGWRADSLHVSVGPPGGPVRGGTVVLVRGACMHAATACVWGSSSGGSSGNSSGSSSGSSGSSSGSSSSNSSGNGGGGTEPPMTAAIAHNESALLCESGPASEPGSVSLALAEQLDASAARATGLAFEYFGLSTLALEPAAGPVGGGTDLRIGIAIEGSAALRRGVRLQDARCRFEGAMVSGTMAAAHASSLEVICTTPAGTAVGLVNVTVSLDAGLAYTAPLPAARAFLYYNASLRAVSPVGGPVRGGTLTTIVGAGLAGGAGGTGNVGDDGGGEEWCRTNSAHCADQMRCRFGVLGGRVIPFQTNDTHVLCTSPPTFRVAEGGPARLAAAVDVLHPDRIAGRSWDDLGSATDELTYSLNGEAYLRPRLAWTYYAPPTISSLQPADGPASGGQEITVRGDGFMNLVAGGAGAARCRFGTHTTRVLEIRNATLLVCAAPQDLAARDAALAAPLPASRADGLAGGIGDDVTFPLEHSGRHCCLEGAGAARVGGGLGYSSRLACQQGCVANPSCRFFSYAGVLGRCDACSSCTDESSTAEGSALYESYRRVEPALPALLPFELSLNGQQFELSDADHTFELGYLMYATASYNVSTTGGPTTGGTLVTITGRGFARGAARAASTRARFGTLWWERNATLAVRCRFGAAGSTTPIQLRDDQIVCPTPPLPSGIAPRVGSSVAAELTLRSGRVTLPVAVALNAARFNGGSLYGSGEPAPAAHDEAFDVAHFEVVPDFNVTLYEQHISELLPPGGPTAGGTQVRIAGRWLHAFAPHAAMCRFGMLPSPAIVLGDADADGGGDFGSGAQGGSGSGDDASGAHDDASADSFGEVALGEDPSSISGLNCTAPSPDPVTYVQEWPTSALPFRLALNYQPRPCEPSVGLVAPAFGPGTFDSNECGEGFRGSFRPAEGMPFHYYAPPTISSIFPVRGVFSGGVALTLKGHGFHRRLAAFGVPILCGFGLSGPTPYPPPNTTSVATLDAATGALRCSSPARLAAGADEAVSVALNGHDFEGGGEHSRFAYIAPLLPRTSFPLGGPVAGGSVVHVLGAGLLNRTDGMLRCRFGDAEGAADYVALERHDVEGELDRTNFDVALARNETGVLRCVAPRAHVAGATALLVRNFDHDTYENATTAPRDDPNSSYYDQYYSKRLHSWYPLGLDGNPEMSGFDWSLFDLGMRGFGALGPLPTDSLRGDALFEGGSLRLTQGAQLDALGDEDRGVPSLARSRAAAYQASLRSSTGSLVLARADMAPAAVIHHFEAAFELSQPGHSFSGRGISFCYGLPPEGNLSFGKEGTRSGLNVHLLTLDARPPANQLQVSYDGREIETLTLGTALREATWTNMTIRYDEYGLAVTHNGRRRIVSLPIYGYAPTTAWHFSVGARAGPHGDTHLVDNLRIRSGELLREGTVPFSVSVNGRDFAPVPGGFRYVTPPVISVASPASGPVAGGTVVTVGGFGFGSGMQLECRFQKEVVYATVLNSSAVRCVTPLAPRLNVSRPPLQPIELSMSLHGAWEPPTAIATLPWLLRTRSEVSSFSPESGPLAGGTHVIVQASALAGGVDYRCRFGLPNRTVGATYDDVSETLRCVAPAYAAISALEITLNGQQYSSSGRLFSQYEPFLLRSLEPSRAASLGGALMHVSFDAFGQPLPFEAIRCRVGEAPPMEPLQHTDQWALCVVPPSYSARAIALDHTLEFNDANASTDGVLRLSTTGDAKIAEGVLMLTDPSPASPFLSAGQQIATGAKGIGSAVLTLRRPYNALHWFELSFELLIGSTSHMGGFGLSINLGELNTSLVTSCEAYPSLWGPNTLGHQDGRAAPGVMPPNCLATDYWEPFGEDGAGSGLRLKFLTRREHVVQGGFEPNMELYEGIEVWYAGEQLLVVPLGKTLRTSSWVPVYIRYDGDGLHVAHNGRVWIERYQIRGWSPQPSWRLGFGARGAPTLYPGSILDVGPDGLPGEAERHWIDHLRVTSGLLVAEATAPVTLSFNGQQYAPAPAALTYYAMPAVSKITPTTGPVAGETLVRVSGSKLDLGQESTDSFRAGYRCRYGDVPQLAGYLINQTELELPRISHDLGSSSATCPPYARAHAHAHADCFYGAQVVNATYGDEFAQGVYGMASARGSVSCVTPSRADPRTLAIELSLNGQQYTTDATPYGYYTEAVLSSVLPLSGPQQGGTALLINASFLGNGSDSRCRFFGFTPPELHAPWAEADLGGESPATFDVAQGLVRCVSPPLPEVEHGGYMGYPNAYIASLRITKNGQNYDLAGLPFSYFRQPRPLFFDPPGGPLEGHTTVTLFGGFSGGFTQDYVCRFGAVLVPATHQSVPTERLLCISPPLDNGTVPELANVTHARPVPLHVSLNGQQFHPIGTYSYYDDPAFESLTPPSGPDRGGTQVSIVGVGLAANVQPRVNSSEPNSVVGVSADIVGQRALGLDGMHQYYCRFGPLGKVEGTYAAASTLRCDSPPFGATGSAAWTVLVSVTLNDQDYEPAYDFQYYAEPIISALLPPTGPTVGNTTVVVVGSSSFELIDRESHFASYACQVGDAADLRQSRGQRFPATRSQSDPTRLLCTTPALLLNISQRFGFRGDEGLFPLPFTVSLNGQQFTPRTPLFLAADGTLFTPSSPAASNASNATVSLGAHSMSHRAINFTYIGVLTDGSLALDSLPTSGPSSGATSIVVYGRPRELAGGSRYQCRLGPQLLEGTYLSDAGGIRCTTGPFAANGTYSVEVSLNGQQFTDASRDGAGVRRQFAVYDPPHLADTFPRSAPTLVATALRLSGRALSRGSDYVCRFSHAEGLAGRGTLINGSYVENATEAAWGSEPDRFLPPPCCSNLAPPSMRCLGHDHSCTAASFVSDHEVRCATPQVLMPRLMSVRLTLNGQQYALGTPTILVYPPPVIDYSVPSRGSMSGGTSVLVHGRDFMPAVASQALAPSSLPTLRCAFGPQKVPGTALSSSVVRCFTPPGASAGALNEIRIGGAGNASADMLSAQMLRIGTRGPPSWMRLGRGGDGRTGGVQAGGPGSVQSGSASAGGASDESGRSEASDTYDHGTHATFDSGHTYRHNSSSASFGGELEGSPLMLYGDARLEEGLLKLTRSIRNGADRQEIGFVILRDEAFFAPPQRSFTFDFLLRMGGTYNEPGGEGFSISYGDLPNPPSGIGERGAGLGLRILMRTYVHNQLLIMWSGDIVHSVGVDDLRTRTDGEFAHVHIRMLGQVLELWYRGVSLIHELRCPWFEPRADWTWALGARAGQRGDDHWIGNFTMRSSHSVHEVGAVELRVSLNDQEYTPGPTPFHVYYGEPSLTPGAAPCRAPSTSTCALAFSPTSGPTAGGTRVLMDGEALGHGYPYTCRFGNAPYPHDPFYPSDSAGHYARLSAMVAGCTEDPLNTLLPLSARGDAATCMAPPPVSTAYSHDPYSDWDDSSVSKSFVPAGYVPGTTAGRNGTVRVFGSALCVAPAAQTLPVPANATSLVSLEISLNAQDYTRNRANFTYYAPPAVLGLSPSSGPLAGGTRVLVLGANLTGGSDYRCAFGTRSLQHSPIGNSTTAPVFAEAENLTATTLVCTTPAHLAPPRSLDVAVTLNGQQYSARTAPFSVHAPVDVLAFSPASGPRLGATEVTLSGGPFVNGSDYRCRFIPSAQSSEYWRESAGVLGGAEHWNELEAVNATVVGEALNASSLRCLSPPQLRPLVAHIETTLNGQQYTTSRRRFEYTDSLLTVSSVSPSSGPHHGGTRLVVHGHGLRLGAHYCCRLDGIVLPASLETAGSGTRLLWNGTHGVPAISNASAVDAVRCITPDAAQPIMTNQTLTSTNLTSSSVRLGVPLSVRIATNCQQYSAPHAGVNFTYFGSPPESIGSSSELGWPPSRPPVPLAPHVPGLTDFAALPLKELNFSARDLRVSGHQVSQLINTSGFTAAELWNGGYTIDELRVGGFGAHELSHAGASAAELRAGGFTSIELRAAGFSALELELGGYSRPQLFAAGFVATAVSPASGPNDGNTNVTIFGGPFVNGSDYRCRFTPLMLLVPGTPSADGSKLHCQSPAVSVRQLHTAIRMTAAPPPPAPVITPRQAAINARLPYEALYEPETFDSYNQLVRIAVAEQNAAAAAAHAAAVAAAALPPPAGSLPTGTVSAALEVTLNGQQFSVNTFLFETYAAPMIRSLSPASGPTLGGTLLHLVGRELGHGSHRLCRFAMAPPPPAEVASGEGGSGEGGSGDEATNSTHALVQVGPAANAAEWQRIRVAGAEVLAVTVDASVVAGGGALLCRTPLTSSALTLPSVVEVALNGQQFSSGGTRFDFFTPPAVSAVYPLLGPPAGGTSVLLTGTGFHDFGRVSAFPGAREDLRCRFGNETVFVLAPTTWVQESGVRCTSPPLSQLEVMGELRYSFDAQPNASALLGNAYIADGILVLTQPTPRQIGTFVVRPDRLVPAPTAFDASFEVLIGGGTTAWYDNAHLGDYQRGYEPLSGMGFAFNFGPFDSDVANGRRWPEGFGTAFSEQGAPHGRGLRVALITYTSRLLEVAYDGAMLIRVPLRSELRILSWALMRVLYVAAEPGAPGGSGGLSVWYDGVRRVTNLTVPGWAPNASWSWALSASTQYETATDAHWVDNLVIQGANLSLGVEFPVALTLNRREVYETGQTFRYAPLPVLSRIHPTGGPLAGGTVVSLFGVNLANGTHYKCRFGGEAPTPALGGPVLDGPVPGSLPLEQFMTPATYTGDAELAAGPSYAAFGEVLGAGVVRCVSPNVSAFAEPYRTATGDVVTLELSVNGQEYTQQSHSFSRYAPILTAVYPLSGPLAGAFRVELSGANLANGSEYRCRFELPFNVSTPRSEISPSPPPSAPLFWLKPPSPPPPQPLPELGSGDSGGGSGDSGSGESGSADSGSGDGGSADSGSGDSGSGDSGSVASGSSDGSGTGSPDEQGAVPASAPSEAFLHARFLVTEARLETDARTAGRRPAHDAVICSVPAEARYLLLRESDRRGEASELKVAVSLNAQQYTSGSESEVWWPASIASLVLYPPPTLTSISPSSGPALGGTRITVSGSNLTSGSNYTCRFGEFSREALPGTLETALGSSVRCIAPPVVLQPCTSPSIACRILSERISPLDVAPNGQDYADRAAVGLQHFVSYRPPELDSISPSSGPSAGATVVDIGGVRPPTGGSDYRCRFVSAALANATALNTTATRGLRSVTVHATFDETRGVVRCVTPGLLATNATASAAVLVALNGQQYHGQVLSDGETDQVTGSMTFHFYGVPSVTAISPSCGPIEGATNLTVSGTQLGGGSDYRCRFADRPSLPSSSTQHSAQHSATARRFGDALVVNASTSAYYDSGSGSLWCLTPAGLASAAALYVEVTLNGQESTADGVTLVRYAPIALGAISPASGPVSGATRLRIEGVGAVRDLASLNGCDVRCRFAGGSGVGSGVAPLETLALLPDLASGSVQCESPRGAGSGALELSLNGQQYSSSRLHFAAYPPIVLHRIAPPLGPQAGGTTVLLHASNLSAVGTDLRCRFSTLDGPFNDAIATRVELAEGGAAALSCLTLPRAVGVDQVRITLNGQQLSPPVQYAVLPRTRVHSIYPLATPERGGIVVTVHGDGFASTDGQPELLRCQIGATTVVGTLLNQSAVRCTTPPAQAAGLARRVHLNVEEAMLYRIDPTINARPEWEIPYLGYAQPTGAWPLPAPHEDVPYEAVLWWSSNSTLADLGASLFGDARLFRGSIVLTEVTESQRGGFLFLPPTVGSRGSRAGTIEPPRTSVHHTNSSTPFPTAFRLSLELTMGTGLPVTMEPPLAERESGDGFSISIGELPNAAAGELGSGNGLRISLLTRRNLLSVSYADRSLLSTPLPDAERLRSNISFPIELIMRTNRLSLTMDGRAVLSDAPLPEWAEAVQPEWRVGLGARTNARRGELHVVDNLVFEISPSLEESPARLEVTPNGQQYSTGDTRLRYLGDAQVSLAGPALGPAHGGTQVLVHGASMHGGSAYRCRFGARVVEAAFEPASTLAGRLVCTSPPLAEALDGLRAFDGSRAEAGSAEAGSGVIGIGDDGSGDEGNGDGGSGDGAMLGYDSLGDMRGNVTLAISLNEQDFEPSTLTFSYYEHPIILAISPHAGPVRGQTRVTVIMSASEAGGLPWRPDVIPSTARAECRFGSEKVVPASWGGGMTAAEPYHDSGSQLASPPLNATGLALTCVTPMLTAGQHRLSISLNRQDYRLDGAPNFTFYEPGVVRSVLPSGGPRRGGTIVTLTGTLAPAHVSARPALCRFGRHAVAATVDTAQGALRCTSPSAAAAGVEIEGDMLASDGQLPLDAAQLEMSRRNGRLPTGVAVNVNDTGVTGALHAAYTAAIGGSAQRGSDARSIMLVRGAEHAAGHLAIIPHRIGMHVALRWFEAHFEAFSDGTAGLSISVGDVPGYVGQSGGGSALRVLFAKRWRSLTILYAGERLRVVMLDDQLQGLDPDDKWSGVDCTSGADGQVDCANVPPRWRSVRLAYLEDGLHLSFDEQPIVTGLALPRWAPASDWRLVFGASTEFGYGRLALRALRLRTDAAVGSIPLPLSVSLNGQQFEPEASFAQYAHPEIRSVAPSAGPVLGGTRILVRGLTFGVSASEHRCRFGVDGLVHATRYEATGLLACISPALAGSSLLAAANGTRAGTAPMVLSATLNFTIELRRDRQLLGSEPAGQGSFTYYTVGAIAGLGPHPASGPISGGTLLSLAVGGLANSSGLFSISCRYDLRGLRVARRAVDLARAADVELVASAAGFNASRVEQPALTVAASYGTAVGSVEGRAIRCLSPAVHLTDAQMIAGSGAELPVAISLNAQQYTPLQSAFHLHEHPQLVLVSPACGPVSGETRLTVVGNQLRGGSAYRCRLGNTSVTNATYENTLQGDLLHCATPREGLATLLRGEIHGGQRSPAVLYVSLNAQQYVDVPTGRLAPGTAPGFAPADTFSLYLDPPRANLVRPIPDASLPVVPSFAASMDSHNGTRSGVVTIFSHVYFGGCDYRCRFGGSGAATATGSFQERDGGIRCQAPIRPAGTSVELWVSLNGQQFVPTNTTLTWT